jgi:ATP-dependent RNA helicase RhlE
VGGAEEFPAQTATLSALGLTPELIARAGEAGWVHATPIQADAIPAILQGDDVLGLAPTGSGKTAAFLLPVLQRLLAVPGWQDERPRPLRALVLAPTRELAQQIEADATALAPGLKTVLAVGGVSINPQMMALRGGAHLVVATPGRLLDLVGQRALLLGGVQTLVLDEADRLLDLGFADEIARVLAWLPARRQTLLFSATLPASVAVLAEQVLRDPVRIDARPGGDAPVGDVTQRAIEVDTAKRTPLLRQLIKQEGWTRVLVFVATQYASEHVADKLRQAGLPAAALHGQLSAGRRRQALLDLAEGRLAVLVATDLAARGLDVDGLQAVVNHDLPRSAVDHTHRIGRTGRAGVPGLAVSFICADAPGSEAHFRLIEKRQAQRVPRERVAGFEPASGAPPTVADPLGGIKGRRKSKKDKLREAAGRA